jgi:hypothetical protein
MPPTMAASSLHEITASLMIRSLNLRRDQKEQAATLDHFLQKGKTFVLTFAASKKTFPETRLNFVASMIAHPDPKSRLLKEFWYGGEKIYEVYEIDRSPRGTAIRPSNSKRK